jgi:hypothetical protein
MNTKNESPDKLLNCLAEEASDLPIRAAIDARQITKKRRKNHQESTLVATTAILAIISWTLSSSVPKNRPESGEINDNPTVTPAVIQQLPAGLDPEQMAFIQATGDIPLLLVRNSEGKVTRIHLIER